MNAPQEDDIVIHTPAWGPSTVCAEGKVIYEDHDFHRCIEAAREWMDTNKWWPNLWQVNERGMMDLLDNEGNIVE